MEKKKLGTEWGNVTIAKISGLTRGSVKAVGKDTENVSGKEDDTKWIKVKEGRFFKCVFISR